MELATRSLQVEDFPRIADMMALIYGEKARSSIGELAAANANELFPPRFRIAELDSALVGIAGFKETWMDRRVASLFWVNVHPRFRRRGIGTRLVTEVIAECRTNGIELMQLTTTSSGFYRQNFGFSHIYTFGPTHRHFMVLKLS